MNQAFYESVQLLGLNGFREILVESYGQIVLPKTRGCVRGDRDDRNVGASLFPAANFGGCFDAIHPRHMNVHQHQVDDLAPYFLQKLAAVRDRRHVIVPHLQQLLQQRPAELMVFGDKNTDWGARFLRFLEVALRRGFLERRLRETGRPVK